MNIRDVKRAFTNKLGAEEDDRRDHIYFYLNYEGSQYTVGKLSHSWSGDLNDTQVGMLSRKLCLRKQQFESFVDCTLNTDQTIDLWQSNRQALQ